MESAHTPILPGDEVNPVTKLDLKTAVAHEILQADPGDDPGTGSCGIPSRLRENLRIRHPSLSRPGKREETDEAAETAREEPSGKISRSPQSRPKPVDLAQSAY